MAADDLKLGLVLGYWFAQPPVGVPEQIAAAEELGFDSIWSAEAYGSDCFTPLAWYGSQTTTAKLGTAVCQMSARTPVATAMSALTLDHLTGREMQIPCPPRIPQPRPLDHTPKPSHRLTTEAHRSEVPRSPGQPLGGWGLPVAA